MKPETIVIFSLIVVAVFLTGILIGNSNANSKVADTQTTITVEQYPSKYVKMPFVIPNSIPKRFCNYTMQKNEELSYTHGISMFPITTENNMLVLINRTGFNNSDIKQGNYVCAKGECHVAIAVYTDMVVLHGINNLADDEAINKSDVDYLVKANIFCGDIN